MVDTGRTPEGESNLNSASYYNEHYFTEKQLYSLSAQINSIYKLKPSNILEIGKGNGFVSDFLRKAGYSVTTFDINPSLNPDIVGDVMELDKHFPNGEFSLVTCSEVLEHIPFKYFRKALSLIANVSKQHVFLTLPRCQRIFLDFRFWINLKGFPLIEKSIFLASAKRRILAEHHWEVDSCKSTKKKEIIKVLEEYFCINYFKRFKLNPYHQFISMVVKDSCSQRP
jgi:SAM-dependent methyltransferase